LRSPAPRAGLLALAALLAARPALAHVESGEAGGFVTGLLHPVTGPDHVLAMIAVGLWGAQLGAPAIWLLPVTFPLVMALGGMLGLIGVAIPGVELGIALSALALGLAITCEWRPPLAAAAVLVGLFAICHGHAHGTELPAGQDALLYSLGFVVATGTLHAVGIAIGLVRPLARGRIEWGRLLLRGAGGLVAAGGVYFLWRAVA
jgi:urease accessory protein